MSETETKRYLIQGTPLELIQWITTSPKALEMDDEWLILYREDEYMGEKTRRHLKDGYLVHILLFLFQSPDLLWKMRNFQLGIMA